MNIGWALFPSDSDRRKHRLHKEGEGAEGQVAAHPQSNPAMDSSVMAEELRSWQSLVSLWDRMEDRRLLMHEAPSTFEISMPTREGWVLRRRKTGIFREWRRYWAILKRAHLFLFERPDSSRPSNWYLLRKATVRVKLAVSNSHNNDLGIFALKITLPHRRKLVLGLKSAQDMEDWRVDIAAAIGRGTTDAQACHPLRCAPTLVKQRAMYGIPDVFRGIVWQKLSGADAMRQSHPSRYAQYCRMSASADGRIKRDLARTMPRNEFFSERGRGGQVLLFNVAHAYAAYDDEVGYSQGMNFLCAILLLHMRQEHAFWVLVQMMRRYRLRDLYLSRSPQLAVELFKLDRLILSCTPSLHQHFAEQGFDVTTFTSEWLLTLFAYSFPLNFTYRVWDVFFIKGFTYILQVAIAIIRQFEGDLLALSFEEIVFLLRDIPSRLHREPKLADAILSSSHRVIWDFDALERAAAAYDEKCRARDERERSILEAASLHHRWADATGGEQGDEDVAAGPPIQECSSREDERVEQEMVLDMTQEVEVAAMDCGKDGMAAAGGGGRRAATSGRDQRAGQGGGLEDLSTLKINLLDERNVLCEGREESEP
uniref:Rab-GAP TBC domain-containing protein n=1 Tax=Guillardia theta TaxID=55529 RepID=A0A7S4KTT3_GUITH|mmetsp:Transcript_31012/g.99481  ORF Transcript_31012/g.99481 Transcript_31012/m.99481 type:complete len:596 (+) Transcript_31012:205-1992(+)